ncbi:MAG TPA: RsmD family RNA methyltransferase [Solirubrobacterales bacterium]|nr:RsmD family RNA methyltransferase [Solirubrobacterales bacterium]
MRVVAGELRGRRLKTPKGTAVRPTSDRAREALFSILGDVSGFEVLDLFCGTGALGIEALSRGARHAVLVDDDTSPAQANVDALGITECVDLVRRDAFAYLGSATATFDLILCDPPYKLAARVARDLEKLVPSRLREGGLLVTESPAQTPMELNLNLETDRSYGEASIKIWSVT